jgi:hypothetical protein
MAEDFIWLSNEEIIESELYFYHCCFKDKKPPDPYQAQLARKNGGYLYFEKPQRRIGVKQVIDVVLSTVLYTNQFYSAYKILKVFI